MADEYEYYEEELAEEEYDDNAEYEEYYEEDEQYAEEDGDEYWYEDEAGELKSPPANVLEIMSFAYSQTLLVNQDDLKVEPQESANNFNYQRGRQKTVGGKRREMGRGKTVGADHNIMAVNVIKGLFEHQRLDQLPTALSPEDLEPLTSVVESIICRSPHIPPFVINLFHTSLSNMFGTVNIDFELLNNDYLYIKSVFVDGTESNNSSLRFERIMGLMQNAKISTMQMSNVHVSEASLDSIVLYLANDNHYDQNGHLKNSVNQMIVHRKSGLTYAQIEAQYAEQFSVIGWSMSYDASQQHMIITLNTAEMWHYYDEDFDDEEKEEQQQAQQQAPPSQQQQQQYVQQKLQTMSMQQQQNGGSNRPFVKPKLAQVSSTKTISPPHSNRPSYLMQNGQIPPPPSIQPRGSSDHVEYNMRQTPKQQSLPPSMTVPAPVQEEYAAAVEEEEYEYYYENDDGTFCPASPRMAQPPTQTQMNTSIPPPPSISPPTSVSTIALSPKQGSVVPAPIAATQHQPRASNNTLLMNMQYGMQGTPATNALLTTNNYNNVMAMMGLPPPDSDDDDDNDIDSFGRDKSDRNKLKFLSEVLSSAAYEGRTLFAGFLSDAVNAMQRLNVHKGQCIMKESEYGQKFDLKFFVIEYGVFNVYQRGRRLPMELCGKNTFGEAQLMYGIPQFVTIRAATNKCLVWYLSRTQYYQISWQYFHKPFKNRLKTKLHELAMVSTLGIGSFGRVYLVRDPSSQKTFSLKKLSKNTVIENKQQQHIMNERSVLALVSRTNASAAANEAAARARSKSIRRKDANTFCCKLYGLYQDQFYLYFLMEPLLGGELFTLLRHNKTFSEKVARFYLSCIVVAFDHLHSRNIIYRDIKPENIMLASNGYAKLVDFGLAKPRNNTRTCCGTPEYLAPEIIQNYWQGFEIDFWGLGILLYEMVTGQPPFESYEQILGDAVPHPTKQSKPMSPELWHLMNALLIKLPYQRLGTTANGRKGIQEIYQHPWFQDKMEWNALKAQKFRPPYVPEIENDEDVSNFEEVEPEDALQHETVFDDQSLYKWCEYF